VDEIPFDSTRKRMTTIHRHGDQGLAYVKGAPEVLLQLSNSIHRDGRIEPLSESGREGILQVVRGMAAGGLRVLAFAYRGVSLDGDPSAEEVERDLTFVGAAGMMDPPREEVKEAVATCKRAGIRTVMITGDHGLTARAIAQDIGLLDGDGRVVTGPELDRMSDDALEREVEQIVVCARSSPEHKVRMLEALKKRGHVVAMTGDGVNDAPALKQADIGISMGITGTEVTKQAADMVLADDNFATIVRAIEEGRGIYDNIRKFVRLLLSTNLDEILLIATATLMKLPLPMLPIQILWVNIVSDGLPALALSFDPYDEDIMERRPRSPKEGIFHGMLLFILAAAVVDFIAEVVLLLVWRNTGFASVERIRTIIFTSTILFELVFVFNCRSESHSIFRSNLLQNKLLLLAAATSLALQLLVVYLPFLQVVFQTVPLRPSDWLIVVAIASSGLLIVPEVFIRRS
jgi:Ca2+-transporting ATPase